MKQDPTSLHKTRILLVEDELAIAENIVYAAGSEGFDITHVTLGSRALDKNKSEHFDLIILDVGLPDISGFEVCKTLRQNSEVPIVFLTARSEEIDRVVGLEIGADDYVVKPFSVRELMARIKVIVKRRPIVIAHQTDSQRLFLDEGCKALRYDEHLIELTAHEFGILELLIGAPERVFSRQQIMDAAWHCPEESYDRVVDTHIKSLRQKLRKVNPDDESIVTHRGMGYSFRNRL